MNDAGVEEVGVPGPCAGLRVLELGGGLAGALATMVLADFGADVIRVRPPGDDPAGEAPVGLFLHRGKRSLALDLETEAGRADIRRLVEGMDVVVESFAPGEADRLGVGAEAGAANPTLIRCRITGFGSLGPLADAPADDALVMAKAGIFRDQPGLHRGDGRPVFRSTKEPSYVAAMLAVQGVLAALRARDLSGRGQLVETSLLQALTWRANPFVRWRLPEGEDPSLDGGYGVKIPSGPTPLGSELTGQLLEAKDGRWIVHMLFERDFFPNWIGVLGLGWIWDHERFKGAPHNLPPAAAKELGALIAQRFKERTAAEWMARYVANGDICADVVQTTQQALGHPHVVAAGLTVELDDPRVGRMVQLGPLARIPHAPGRVRGPAPDVAESLEAILRDAPPLRPRPAPTGTALAGPLAGVTIIDAAIFYATGGGVAQLADLGARIIKIEPVAGDPYRRSARGMGGDNVVRAMQGKENLALNLKDRRGQEIAHRLVAGADAFVHNFRLGVPERLGIDYATLRAVNPRLVYHYAAAYGSIGPYARQPAIDHVIAAFTGMTAHQAGAGNRPLKEQGADPVAALGVGAALMLGLRARDASGQSQYVESTMIQSNLYMNVEDALSYAGKPPRRPVDPLQLGDGATHRLYRTEPRRDRARLAAWEDPESCWIFLSAVEDREFTRFCAAAGRHDLAADRRFATRGSRDDHDAALAMALEALFLTRPAEVWESTLLGAGVGCVVADAMSFHAFLHRHPQARALGMTALTAHPSLGGGYWRPAPAITLSDTAAEVGRFCDCGEHSRAILREIGLDDDHIDELRADGVVTWPTE